MRIFRFFVRGSSPFSRFIGYTNIDDPAVQEACAAILREVLHGGEETWKLIAVGAAKWMAERGDSTREQVSR